MVILTLGENQGLGCMVPDLVNKVEQDTSKCFYLMEIAVNCLNQSIQDAEAAVTV